MGAGRVELPTLAGPDPKSGAYASSATRPKSLLLREGIIIISSARQRRERCQSGRSGSPRKRVSPQGDRGFESHPLRHSSPALADRRKGKECSANNQPTKGAKGRIPPNPGVKLLRESQSSCATGTTCPQSCPARPPDRERSRTCGPCR